MLKKKFYLISRLVSGLGNSLYGLVFIWWLQTQTESSFIVGIVNAIFSTTAALSIFYGPIIDSHSYKKTSIVAMIWQVGLTFTLTATITFFAHNYFWAILIAGALSLCDEFFDPADRAILKGTLTKENEMTSMIAQINIVDQVVQIGGIALSGALLAFLTSGQIIFICACLSLLGLILLLVALDQVSSQEHDQVKKVSHTVTLVNYWQQVTSGYQYVRANSFLQRYFWSSLLFSFASPALILLLPRIAQKSGRPALYSTFYLFLMAGFILGALLAGKMNADTRIMAFSWILSVVPLILMLFFMTNMIAFVFLLFIFGIATSIHNVLGEAKKQNVTENQYLARVLTTMRTGTEIGGPIASVVAGALLDHVGQQELIIVCVILILLGGINLLLVKPAD